MAVAQPSVLSPSPRVRAGVARAQDAPLPHGLGRERTSGFIGLEMRFILGRISNEV